jgi:hypothetical protein
MLTHLPSSQLLPRGGKNYGAHALDRKIMVPLIMTLACLEKFSTNDDCMRFFGFNK